MGREVHTVRQAAQQETLPSYRAEVTIRQQCLVDGYTVHLQGRIDGLYEEDGTLNQEKYDRFVQQMEKLSPIRRVGEPIDQAYLVLYLVSDAAKFSTGQIWRANGGQAMAW